MKTQLPSDRVAVVGVVDPDANAAGTLTTGWISMSDFQSIMAVVQAGTLGASATIDAKLEQASDSSGTGAKDIDGAAITQLTKAGSDDDKQAVIYCNAEDLDLQNDFSHVRLSMTIGTANCDSSAIVLGLDPRYAPASNGDLPSVAEIVGV
ncbi:hypothetical protein [Phaeobacter sp. 22II1-1F12B]|uniref:hypothetical protein n=1 Tax=Phaeobacter sp. 22II1-1F12B TaxID=1317111 RepID=UPI000B526258|nr:hypothetical protein [Phaeobacter sp. 22II1-1F12B]OWU80439.1 hypothetical protein ATO1_08795 [Phaeobacter sp. 22II1-1F12B]